MQQILIINSLAEQRFLSFFEKVFATVEVGTAWDDYGDMGKKTGRDDFQKKVEASSALFLVLSREAQGSVQKGDLDFLKSRFAQNKEVFVFEHCEDIDRISIRVPRVDHYFAMYITNIWMAEVTAGAVAFEKVKTPQAALPEVKLERLSPEKVKAFFDPVSGQALFDLSTTRLIAKNVVCPECAAAYRLHAPEGMGILRCPVCGQFCEMT